MNITSPGESKKTYKTRWVKIILWIFFLLLVGRLFQLQAIQGKSYKEKALDNMIRRIPITAPRGNILDRNGEVIARNAPSFGIFILPNEMHDPVMALEEIADVMKLPEKKKLKMLKDFEENENQFFFVNEKMDEETMTRVAELQNNIAGIYLEAVPVRYYPLKSLACHILGYVGEVSEKEIETYKDRGLRPRDIIGKDGIEYCYDTYLRGKDGERKIQVDVANRLIHLLGIDPPVQGDTLYLSLDLDLQKTAEKELAGMVKKIKSQRWTNPSASVVAMDARTGEVLAMASFPGFDLNPFIQGFTSKEYNKLMEDPNYPMLNKAISSAYPCGSVFKLITASASLQEGICNENSVFYCPGVFYLSQHPFYCFVKSGHGSVNFNQAIAQSCDVTFYRLGNSLKLERLLKYAKAAGLGKKTGIDLPGETPGLLPDEEWKQKVYKEPWYAGDTVNLSIGQGYLGATPLQMAVVTAAVANGGAVVVPKIVSRIIDAHGNTVLEKKPEFRGRYPVSDKNLAAVRKGMRAAVTGGTAMGALTSDVDIAGKTGTAENSPCPENPNGFNHAWFTCFFPYENPEVVVTVMFEKSGGFGGDFSAPVARKIAEKYMTLKKEREKKESSKKDQ
ncbi:MAG: penicillin-binding protein 2 [Chloroflexi bacterium]|nr:penicillin-binding protein 2 [Chloroflexota bacterium]